MPSRENIWHGCNLAFNAGFNFHVSFTSENAIDLSIKIPCLNAADAEPHTAARFLCKRSNGFKKI